MANWRDSDMITFLKGTGAEIHANRYRIHWDKDKKNWVATESYWFSGKTLNLQVRTIYIGSSWEEALEAIGWTPWSTAFDEIITAGRKQ